MGSATICKTLFDAIDQVLNSRAEICISDYFSRGRPSAKKLQIIVHDLDVPELKLMCREPFRARRPACLRALPGIKQFALPGQGRTPFRSEIRARHSTHAVVTVSCTIPPRV